MSKSKGLIVYRGPSRYDGAPIVAVLTRSNNRKTGGMVQLWILSDSTDPISASRTGADFSVCGGCKHRGKPSDKPTGWAIGRTCYVNLGQAPLGVYKALQRGVYTVVTTHDQVQQYLQGNMLRLGAYGDPSALPVGLVDLLVSYASGHTGYTHGDTVPGLAVDYSNVMASADSKREAILHHANGNRTFRVIPIATWNAKGKGELLANEIICPATPEGGNKAQCADCLLCNGSKSKAKSIAVVAHGTSKNKIMEG